MGSIDPSCPYQDLLLTDNSRWHRTVQNVYKLKANVWNGDRPKRESLAVMQSILSAVLDYHCRTGRPLGNLGDHSKIVLSECTHSFLGFQQIRFRITFAEPLELDDNLVNLAKDMEEVRKIFQLILRGRELNPELDYLLSVLLTTYPYPKHMNWKTLVLQNYTGLWDSKLRRCFMITLFYTLVSEMQENETRSITSKMNNCSVRFKKKKFKGYKWLKRIPEDDSIFYHILTYVPPCKQDPVGPESSEPPPPKPQYKDYRADSAIKYFRDCLHHNKDAQCSLSSNDLEVCLTNLFPGLVFGSYQCMCKTRKFLGW